MNAQTRTAMKRWRDQRKSLLQSACNEVADQRQQGIRIGLAIKSAAAKFGNSDLGDGRRLQLSENSMGRFYYEWKRTKDPAVFELKYKGPGSRAMIDPLLLRMIVAHALQTGSSVEEALEAIRPRYAKLTIKQIYSAFPKQALDSLSRSHKRLLQKRARREQKFLKDDAGFRRQWLKQRAEFQRRFLEEDRKLRARILRQREALQRRFFEADAHAVQARAALQKRFVNKDLANPKQ